ncbi:hypothetical protein BC834DRAFT_842778 [Gloeopeniophorella convolvens]|nr:hypothetical protein BC834DRAFT_842778 [Gloeopeniophorella convolvens]
MFLPISLLPPELLSRIFRHLRDDIDAVQSPRLGWATVTHVCRRWRQVALEDASLWGKISGVWLRQQWFSEVLVRSKRVPIDLTYHTRPSHAVFSMLSRHFSRIRTLSLRDVRNSPELQEILRSEAPRLQELTLKSMNSRFMSFIESGDQPDRFALFNGQAPKLRKIHLHTFSIPWICFTKLNLTHFIVNLGTKRDVSGALGSLDKLVEFLSESGRALEVLILDGCLNLETLPPHRPRTIELPHLHSLRLLGSSSCIVYLFNLLETPSLFKLSLHFRTKDQTDVAEWPAIVPTVLSRFERADLTFRRLSLDIAKFPSPTRIYASCDVPLPGQDHSSTAADRVSLELTFDAPMLAEDWRHNIVQKVCAAKSMEGLNLVKIRARTSGFDGGQWATLFRPCLEVTALEVHGQSTDLLLRAIMFRSSVTDATDIQAGRHAQSQEGRGTLRVQPFLFPQLISLSLNDLNLTETVRDENSLILSDLANSLMFREGLETPIKELGVWNCTIPAEDAARLGRLVSEFRWDGCESLPDSEEDEEDEEDEDLGNSYDGGADFLEYGMIE